jgi:hypothetical protein
VIIQYTPSGGEFMFDDSSPADGSWVADNNLPYQRSPRLLDKVRNVIRCKHYSIRTEQSYVDWIKRYIFFHNKQHPKDLGEAHISDFLTHLAVQKKWPVLLRTKPCAHWCFFIVRF